MIKYVIVFQCLVLFLTAEGRSKEDMLLLKNGSILRGNCIISKAGTVSIETNCGNVWVFDREEVDTLVETAFQNDLKLKGYYGVYSIGCLIGSSLNEHKAPLSLRIDQLYRINPYLMPGASVGYEFLNEAVVPVGGSLQVFPLPMYLNWFVGLSGGYSLSMENPNEYYYTHNWGGVFYQAETGIMHALKTGSVVFFAVGYRYNELDYTRFDWYYGKTSQTNFYNRLSVRLGMVLH